MPKLTRWLIGSCLPVLTLMACGGGGGGGGSPLTVFKGVASGGGVASLEIIVFRVATVSFSPPAPLFPTASSANTLVAASGSITEHPGGVTIALNGTWDEDNNVLALSAPFVTMTGGYNVPSNDIGGEILFNGGISKLWTGLKGASTTVYCGTWQPGANVTPFAFVVGGTTVRGYGDTDYTPLVGTVSGSSVQFDYNVYPGTGTITASGVTGTIGGVSYTGTVCA